MDENQKALALKAGAVVFVICLLALVSRAMSNGDMDAQVQQRQDAFRRQEQLQRQAQEASRPQISGEDIGRALGR